MRPFPKSIGLKGHRRDWKHSGEKGTFPPESHFIFKNPYSSFTAATYVPAVSRCVKFGWSKVFHEFSSLPLRWTILFLLAQTSPLPRLVLAGIWMCLGEGRCQWSSKATPLTPKKYTGGVGWPPVLVHMEVEKGKVAQKRKSSKQIIQNYLRTPHAFPQVDTQANVQRPSRPGSVQVYCTRNKEAGVGYPAWQRKSWPVSHYVSVNQP